jgi:hypothetical protein
VSNVAAGTLAVKTCAHADHTVCPLGPANLTLVANHTYSVFAVGSLAATVPPVPPATDTVSASSTTTGSTGFGNGALILVAAGIAFLGSLRLIAVRARR